MDEKQRATYLRGCLKTMMLKVPDHISSASIDTVRDFKEWFASTTKQLISNQTPLQKLEAIHQQAEQIYSR